MPTTVQGGGQAQPKPPGDPNNTAVEATYTLPLPVADDVADVPTDLKNLAQAIITQLDLRLTEAAALNAYQGKIVVTTSVPTNPAAYAEGAIIFVVS